MRQKVLGGTLLVAGTTIGAGMLALPVVTGLAGFFPSLIVLILYWIYMTYTALLMLEVNMSMEEHTNLMTMVKNTLGKFGQAISWVVYLFLLYALLTAYMAGSAPMLKQMLESSLGHSVPYVYSVLPLFIFFGSFIYLGTRSVDLFNRILMLALGFLFFLLIVMIGPHVELKRLTYQQPKYILLALSVIATSFGFHIIIPTLRSYFHQDAEALKKSILIGSLCPVIIYIIWNLLALGVIPVDGNASINQGLEQGCNGALLLSRSLDQPRIGWISEVFAFIAIITSFLGVSLSLFDFLSDGFNIKKTSFGKILLYLLTFLPPTLLVLTDPCIFIDALDYAGAFGVMILLGLMPPLMVWSLRYYRGVSSPYRAPGGKFILCLAILFSSLIIGIEILDQTGYLRVFLEG